MSRFLAVDPWWHRRLLLGLALLTLLVPAAARAQGKAEKPATEAESQAESQEGVIAPLPTLEGIDEILEGEEAILSGGGATYDPADRRDPFKSLKVSAEEAKKKGPRPDGIPGLMIDEIVLSGIIKTKRGFLAQIQAANQQKSFLLKAGDQLFDGDVIRISAKEVVFKQNVQDPTALKPFREVVKSLEP